MLERRPCKQLQLRVPSVQMDLTTVIPREAVAQRGAGGAEDLVLLAD